MGRGGGRYHRRSFAHAVVAVWQEIGQYRVDPHGKRQLLR